MKLNKYIYIMSVASLFFISCNKDEGTSGSDNTTPVVTDPVALQLSASGILDSSSEKLETEDKAQTRLSGTSWETSDKIGVFVFDDGSYTVYNEYANIPYYSENTDGKFLPLNSDGVDNTIYFPADGSYKDVIAYYPYRELNDGTFTINVLDQSNQKLIDVMRGYADKLAYNNASPDVKLQFKHRLSKIKVNFIIGEGVTSEQQKQTVVELSGFKLSGNYNPIIDKVTVGNDIAVNPIQLPISADGLSAHGIVLPELASSSKVLSIKPGYMTEADKPYIYNISENLTFSEGKTYLFEITIHRDGIEVVPSVEDWWEGSTEDVVLVEDEE